MCQTRYCETDTAGSPAWPWWKNKATASVLYMLHIGRQGLISGCPAWVLNQLAQSSNIIHEIILCQHYRPCFQTCVWKADLTLIFVKQYVLFFVLLSGVWFDLRDSQICIITRWAVISFCCILRTFVRKGRKMPIFKTHSVVPDDLDSNF